MDIIVFVMRANIRKKKVLHFFRNLPLNKNRHYQKRGQIFWLLAPPRE